MQHTMLPDTIFLLIGLALILVGANALTDGSSALAKRWGVSDLVIGLTVVAFGTSAPELVISVMSAAEGATELAVGNVVGSNIFNLLAIIGVTAMIKPIVVERSILTQEIPLVVLSSLVLLVMGNGPVLWNTPQSTVTRGDGIILLIFFALFMRHTLASAKRPGGEGLTAPVQDGPVKTMPLWKSVVWVVGGLAGLIFGGDLFVNGASGIARGLGVSEAVIGLTIVAAGTSLPELATSVTAAVKGKTALAVGNVVGSNIFNIFLILGVSGVVRPLRFGSIGNFDLLYLMGASLMVWVFGWFFAKRTFTRAEGAVLSLGYVAYIVILLLKI